MPLNERPPIWVISLARAPDRRAAVTRSFAELDLPFELFDAIDGAELTEPQRRRYSRARALFSTGRGLGRGEVGCALSHLAVYERMVARGVASAVVMEDDVVATPELPLVLDTIEEFPRDWDVVTLHSLFPEAGAQPIDDRLVAGSFRVCTYGRLPFGAQCYVITHAAARRLLDVAYPVRLPADDLLFRSRPAGLRVYGIEPRVVRHADVPSELVARQSTGADPTPALYEQPLVIAGKVWDRLRH